MGGSRSRVVGYNYFFSYAGLICHGPVAKLHKIVNQDTDIYVGPLEYSTAAFNADGSTTITTDLGDILFYWGTDSQTANADLSNFNVTLTDDTTQVINQGDLKGICYFVTDPSFQQGNSVSPPNLKFEVEVYPSIISDPNTFLLSGAASNASSTGDVYIPAVVYDLLTNTRYGLGLTNVSQASFEAAQNEMITDEADGLFHYVSPVFDRSENLRQAIGELLSICDGFLRENTAGDIEFILNRPWAAVSALTVNTSNILEEPEIENAYQSDLWTYTLVNYNNRNLEYQDDSSSFDDLGGSSFLGDITREFSYDSILEEEVANTVAIRKGLASSIPYSVIDVICHPSVGRQLSHGDYVTFDYSPLGYNSLCRVIQVTNGGGLNLESRIKLITVRSQVDPADITDLDLQLAIKDPVIKDTTDPNKKYEVTDLEPHIAFIPRGIFPAETQGLVVAGSTDQYDQMLSVYYKGDPFAYNPGKRIGSVSSTPARGTIQWYEVGANNRITLSIAWDDISSGNKGHEQKNRFTSITDDLLSDEPVYAVCCKRQEREDSSVNQHLLESIWFALSNDNDAMQTYQSTSGQWITVVEADMGQFQSSFGNIEIVTPDSSSNGRKLIGSTVYVGQRKNFGLLNFLQGTDIRSNSGNPLATYYVTWDITTVDGKTVTYAENDLTKPIVSMYRRYQYNSANGAPNVEKYPFGRFIRGLDWVNTPLFPNSAVDFTGLTDPTDYKDWGESPEPYIVISDISTTYSALGYHESNYGLADADTASKLQLGLGDQSIGWNMHYKLNSPIIDGSNENNPYILQGLDFQYGYIAATKDSGGYESPIQAYGNEHTGYFA